MVVFRKVEERVSQSRKARKETKERTKESTRREKDMEVETIATRAVSVEDMAIGEMSALKRTMSIR